MSLSESEISSCDSDEEKDIDDVIETDDITYWENNYLSFQSLMKDKQQKIITINGDIYNYCISENEIHFDDLIEWVYDTYGDPSKLDEDEYEGFTKHKEAYEAYNTQQQEEWDEMVEEGEEEERRRQVEREREIEIALYRERRELIEANERRLREEWEEQQRENQRQQQRGNAINKKITSIGAFKF